MNKHRNGQTYKKYVGNTKRGRQIWKSESTQKGDMNLNVKMMIHETRKD